MASKVWKTSNRESNDDGQTWSDEVLFEADAQPTEVVIREDEEETSTDEAPATEEEEIPEGQPEGEIEPEGDVEPDVIPETEAEPDVPPTLSEAELVAIFKEGSVNPLVAQRLATQQFQSKEDVVEAIAAELKYLKAATSSGKPFGMQENVPQTKGSISIAERDKRLDEINSRHLGTKIPDKTE